MHKEDCILIGKIGRTTGNDGNLTAHLNSKIPEFSDDIGFLHVDQGPGELVPYPVEFLSGTHSTVRLKFEFVDSVEEASGFVGKDLYLSLADINESEDTILSYHSIIGWTILNSDKTVVGKISDVIENPGQDLFVIHKGEKEILIPVHEDFIVDIDEDKEIMVLNLPDGLLEVNE